LGINDLRFQINGLQRLKELYEELRMGALERVDYLGYRQIYDEFERAM